MGIKTYQRDEFIKLLGIDERTLRYYEEFGLLKGTKKRGRRIYGESDLALLNFLKDLKCVGLSYSEIKKFARVGEISRMKSEKEMLKLCSLLEGTLEKIESKIEELKILKENFLDLKQELGDFETFDLPRFSSPQIQIYTL